MYVCTLPYITYVLVMSVGLYVLYGQSGKVGMKMNGTEMWLYNSMYLTPGFGFGFLSMYSSFDFLKGKRERENGFSFVVNRYIVSILFFRSFFLFLWLFLGFLLR